MIIYQGNEEGNTRAETVTLLEHLVEEEDDDAGEGELDDEEGAGDEAELGGGAVETGDDVDDGLGDGEDDAEELLGTLKESTLFLVALVELDELDTSEELHDHGRSDDGGDTELHEGTSTGISGGKRVPTCWKP